jgi:transcriptional regulator with XRE-family HTH domain
MNIKKKLGSKIKEIRKSKKYTQEFVAEKIGIETKSLSNIERGLFYPTAENLEKISKILEVQPFELFDFEHHKSDEEIKKEILKTIEENPNKLKQIYKVLKAII